MDEQRLTEIEAREKAATPGPWGQWRGDDNTCATVYGIGPAGERPVVFTEHPNFTAMHPWPNPDSEPREVLLGTRDEDEEFIAHARQDVLDLLAEVRRLQAPRPLTATEVMLAQNIMQSSEEWFADMRLLAQTVLDCPTAGSVYDVAIARKVLDRLSVVGL